MDISLLTFFTFLSIVLYVISRLTHTPWVSLSLGWIAGGILLVLGYMFAEGEQITATTVIDVGVSVTTALDYGISSENMFILIALLGVVMIFSSSGDWI